jgi:hypothetical protein
VWLALTGPANNFLDHSGVCRAQYSYFIDLYDFFSLRFIFYEFRAKVHLDS